MMLVIASVKLVVTRISLVMLVIESVAVAVTRIS